MRFTVGDVFVDLIDADDMVVAAFQRDGEFEPEPLKAWGDVIRRQGNVIDVGSYTGLYAIAAAAHGCRVMAFEPNPYVQARLRHNVALNKVSVAVSGYALSDVDDCLDLHMNRAVKMTSAATLEAPGSRMFSTKVRSYRLDTVMIKLVRKIATSIDAIKIDVEGHEEAVLRGAAETLRNFEPIILIELLSDDAVRRVDAILTPMGYRGGRLDSRNFLYEQTRTEV